MTSDPGTRHGRASAGRQDQLSAGMQLISTVVGCRVQAVTDAAFWDEFEQHHCFDQQVQPAFTAAFLRDFDARMETKVIYELAEPLAMHLTLLRVEGQLIVIGPYVRQPLVPGESEAVLAPLRLGGSLLKPYTLYRSRYPLVDSEYAMRGAVALVEAAGLDTSSFGYERVDADVAPLGSLAAHEPPHSAPFEVIARRYVMEGDFMNAISAGDERSALNLLKSMANVRHLPDMYYSSPSLGATIMRIICRTAAQQAGLPSVTVDAISQSYAQRLHRSGLTPDSEHTSTAIVEMVSEFCRAVHRYNRRPYSGPVRQVIDEIEMHLSHQLAPAELAARLGVSQSHLSRQFKQETGMTISRYAAQLRVDQAAHLLATTRQPIGEIAAFVGYLDAGYFVKVFRSVHGVTPSAYRAQALAPPEGRS